MRNRLKKMIACIMSFVFVFSNTAYANVASTHLNQKIKSI